jgi:hypothetical protein
MRKRDSLEVILEDHLRKMLKRTDIPLADELRLLDTGVKLVAAQAKLKTEDKSDGAFFQGDTK